MTPAKECIRILPLDLPGEVRREETKNPESFGVYENCQCLYVCMRKEIATSAAPPRNDSIGGFGVGFW